VVFVVTLTWLQDNISGFDHCIDPNQRQGGFVFGQAVGDDSGHEVDGEIEIQAVAVVFNLTGVLQFVEDSLDQRHCRRTAFSKGKRETRFMFFSYGGDELDAHVVKHLSEPFGDVSLLGVEHAEQPLAKVKDGFAVVEVAGGQRGCAAVRPFALALGSLEQRGVGSAQRGISSMTRW